jgi:hypothetical protein
MRIRIIQKPSAYAIDGLRLDQFRLGTMYDLSSLLAGVFLAEGWAEPADNDEPPQVVPVRNIGLDPLRTPANLTREFFPPYYDGSAHVAAAAERPLRRRPRHRRK